MKVVINKCFGGFGLSDEAAKLFKLAKEGKTYSEYDHDINRSDEDLIKIVEELGDKASGRFAELRIIEIPEDIKWYVHDYDGMESIYESHQSWH